MVEVACPCDHISLTGIRCDKHQAAHAQARGTNPQSPSQIQTLPHSPSCLQSFRWISHQAPGQP